MTDSPRPAAPSADTTRRAGERPRRGGLTG
jgi:hypothetical protein